MLQLTIPIQIAIDYIKIIRIQVQFTIKSLTHILTNMPLDSNMNIITSKLVINKFQILTFSLVMLSHICQLPLSINKNPNKCK